MAPKVLHLMERQPEGCAVMQSFCLDLSMLSATWLSSLSPRRATGTSFELAFLSLDLPLPALLCGVRAQPRSS